MLRFAALASHYLSKPCFCRPGTGDDKGGVEARGKALRRQALVPIPSGATLEAINAVLLAHLDARLYDQRSAAFFWYRRCGSSRSSRSVVLGRLCASPEATTLVTVSPHGHSCASTARTHAGAVSVGRPRSGGAYRSDHRHDCGPRCATARHPIRGFASARRLIDYRHYLPELARKPQAVRQVLPDLLPRSRRPLSARLGAAAGGLRIARGRPAIRQRSSGTLATQRGLGGRPRLTASHSPAARRSRSL